MSIRHTTTAALAALSLLSNSLAFGATPSRSGAEAFEQSYNRLRGEVDLGRLSSEEASRALIQDFSGLHLTRSDIESYLKSKLSVRDYALFRSQLAASTRGISSENMSSEEWATLLAQALGDGRSEGLSWSACHTRTLLISGGLYALVALFIVLEVKNEAFYHETDALYEIERQSVRDHAEAGMAAAATVGEYERIKADRDRALRDINDRFQGELDGGWHFVDGWNAPVIFFGGIIATVNLFMIRECDKPGSTP